jgi:hypothetical protein
MMIIFSPQRQLVGAAVLAYSGVLLVDGAVYHTPGGILWLALVVGVLILLLATWIALRSIAYMLRGWWIFLFGGWR